MWIIQPRKTLKYEYAVFTTWKKKKISEISFNSCLDVLNAIFSYKIIQRSWSCTLSREKNPFECCNYTCKNLKSYEVYLILSQIIHEIIRLDAIFFGCLENWKYVFLSFEMAYFFESIPGTYCITISRQHLWILSGYNNYWHHSLNFVWKRVPVELTKGIADQIRSSAKLFTNLAE